MSVELVKVEAVTITADMRRALDWRHIERANIYHFEIDGAARTIQSRVKASGSFGMLYIQTSWPEETCETIVNLITEHE